MEILVCDDQDPKSIVDAVGRVGIGEPDAWGKDEFTNNLHKLFKYANGIFRCGDVEERPTCFDRFDLILLDFGLTALESFPHRLTAEHVAGYIRALTCAGCVVSINKLANVDFDLKYLLGDFETKTDLALNTNLLSQNGLWDGNPENDEFCPWYWPRLNEAAIRRRAQIKLAHENIDKPILETLGFPAWADEHLSTQAIAFLSPDASGRTASDAKPVRGITFWDHFCNSHRTLTMGDRLGLLNRAKDGKLPAQAPKEPNVRDMVARIVAGELDFWFRRDILGPQRLLIDAPHLQMKYRFRPNENGDLDFGEWSRTAREWTKPYGLDRDFFAAVEDAEFKQSADGHDLVWTDKPCFWHPLIGSSEKFECLADNHSRRRTEIVFCEDTRSFIMREKARRFETALGRGIDIRYVAYKKDFRYSPLSQMAR